MTQLIHAFDRLLRTEEPLVSEWYDTEKIPLAVAISEILGRLEGVGPLDLPPLFQTGLDVGAVERLAASVHETGLIGDGGADVGFGVVFTVMDYLLWVNPVAGFLAVYDRTAVAGVSSN